MLGAGMVSFASHSSGSKSVNPGQIMLELKNKLKSNPEEWSHFIYSEQIPASESSVPTARMAAASLGVIIGSMGLI